MNISPAFFVFLCKKHGESGENTAILFRVYITEKKNLCFTGVTKMDKKMFAKRTLPMALAAVLAVLQECIYAAIRRNIFILFWGCR